MENNANTFVKALCLFISVLCLLSCDGHLRNEPPLHQAAYKGDVEELQQLIKSGADVEAKNTEGATALHWAAFKGQLEAAKILVRYGANVNAHTKKGSTPLRLAQTHKQTALESFLKSRGGEI